MCFVNRGVICLSFGWLFCVRVSRVTRSLWCSVIHSYGVCCLDFVRCVFFLFSSLFGSFGRTLSFYVSM